MAQPIQDLGKGGLNTDVPPMVLPPNVFTDCLNVRFDDESVQTITGETTSRVVSTAPDYGIHWRRPDQGYNIFAKNGTIVRVDSAGNQSTMFNSASAIYNNSDWQGTLFNGGYAIVLNNGKSTPLYCLYGSASADSAFLPLPGWNYTEGLTITAKVIRSVNYSLVAANLTVNDGSTITYAPSTIRISVQAVPGAIPTIWEPGLTTDTADEFELNSTSPILDMQELRGNMFIYSSDSISVLSIGVQTKISPYSKSYGILNTDCVVEVDGKHFVVDRNDIYVHSGSGSIESIADFRIKKYFFSNLNKNAIDKVHLTKNPFNKELWINYPKGSSTVCNESLIYNYKNNTWTKRTLPLVTYSFNGPSNINNQFLYGEEVIYMTTNSTQTLVTNNGYLMWNGSALASYNSYVEKKKLNTGFIEGSTLINSLYPVFDQVPSNSEITITVTGQNNYLENEDFSNVSGRDTFVFKPNETTNAGYKVDPRVVGRVLNYKISSSGYWRLATAVIEAKPSDRR